MPETPILNPAAVQALRELSPEGDTGFLRELIDIYLADTPKQLAQLESALAQQDSVVAMRAAHTLKGSSGNFGAEQFSKIAHEAEDACKAGNLSTAASLLPDLRKQFALVADALKQLTAGG